MAKRILIVDDSPTQLDALRDILEHAGFEVVAARRGEDALRVAAQSRIDLVVSDVMMPGISGYQLCRRLKEEGSAPPPVVLLTSLSDPRDVVRGLECGADSYVTKPYEPQQLLERVRRVLENRELRAEGAAADAVSARFLGESFTIQSDAPRILELLLSSFEDLVRANRELEESKAALREAHGRELEREQAGRREAEENARRMEALKRSAEAAAQARDEVLAAVSHDLRNPLGTIHTSAALLLDVELSGEARRRQLQIIRRTAERMNRLIQDLLDVARIESGFFAIEPRPVPVTALMHEAVEQFRHLADEKTIRFEHEVAEADLHVHADRGRVLQVVSNLVGNALKFTPEGGHVRLGAVRTDRGVRFTVTDTGPGIEPQHLPRIFDRFWQGGGASAGAGLGLAIAKGIVQSHGGEIWAENTEQGAAFHFTLPAAAPEAELES
jgi:two-component system, sensor histidine kinase and response regulator